MKLGVEVGLGRGYIVSDGDPATLLKGAQPPPQFSAHVCRGKTTGWIKMPLRMDVGLGPGDNVSDWNPSPKKGDSSPYFSTHVL